MEKIVLDDNYRIFYNEGVKYILNMPPHSGCRSVARFFVFKGVVCENLNPDMIRNNPDMFVVDHKPIPEEFEGKIITTVRNPLDRIATSLRSLHQAAKRTGYNVIPIKTYFEYLFFNQDRMWVIGSKESKSEFIAFKKPIHNIITHHLRGKLPDYIIHTETQEQSLLKLPFIKNLEGYKPYSTFSSFSKKETGYKKHFNIEEKEYSIKVKNYVRENFKSEFNEYFKEEFENFGYDPL